MQLKRIEFNISKYFAALKKRSRKCAKFLEDVGLENWTRCYCKGDRINMMTSNIGESLNAVISIAKGIPIV